MRGGIARRVPADRGAPAAGRVLRRHRRGDPLLQGRRPAQLGRRPSTACGRRRAASCCLPRRSGRGPRNSPPSTRRWPTCSASSPTGSPSRAWRRSRPCSPTGWSCCSTTCRAAASCSPATRADPGPGGRTRRDQPGVPRGVLGQRRRRGGEAPVDLGAAAFQPIARIRAAAAALGLPGGRSRRSAVTEASEPSRRARRHEQSAGPDQAVQPTVRVNRPRSGSTPHSHRPIAATPPA